MISREREIWITANLLIKSRGDDAEAYALERIETLEGNGEDEGAQVFRQVLSAIASLRQEAPDTLN